jgi:hypothetical protein
MMNDAATPAAMRLVREHFTRTYASVIDMDDLAPGMPPDYRERSFLSRALAAQAVSLLTGCGPEEAASSLVDGPGDAGIDAIAFSASGSDIWFVQAKWSDTGKARLREEDAARLVVALQHLADHRYTAFNSRIDALAGRISDALHSPRGQVHLVVALAGAARLTRQAEEHLSLVEGQFGFAGRIPVKVHTLGLADFHSAARSDVTTSPVTLSTALTDGWHTSRLPHPAWIASISAGELAAWYDNYRDRLFAPALRRHNVAQAAPETVNRLVADPEDFWYFTPGVTVLCDRVEASYFGRRAPSQPVRLRLENARVVTGAQTVASVAHAVARHPDIADRALVPLRIICPEDTSADLADKIAQMTETEGLAGPLDAVALDPNQRLIRNEFLHFLNKEYVYKKDAVAPAPDTGCTVQEAAIALVCAQPDASLVARVSADATYLWRPSPEGVYTRLFARHASVRQIWKSVLLLRQVRSTLVQMAAGEPPRARDLVKYGELLIAHLVFQSIDADRLDELDESAGGLARWVTDRTLNVLSLLDRTVQRMYGQHLFLASVFTDERKCLVLADTITRALDEPTQRAEDVPSRPRRRPNSVSVLIEHGRIVEGTRLIYQPNVAEERAIGDWLSEDPSRYLATWTNHPRHPLIWAVDQQAYSPSALVLRIWREAQWDQAPTAVQGTRCWSVPGEGTLAEIAKALMPVAGGDGGA